ncbi:hypothetical protein [Alkaliphilus transvaalensis]|uniref:hypothetical protein n=1 Tax=Alkaliphilus transvaalensis TaxID=114628 RepID=UPI00047CA336|nr:hypothetical protein [Alkaliphilus transvaalensis]
MCQLNLYLVPKNIPAKKIISIFEKYNLSTSIDCYNIIDSLADDYTFYSTSSHCDCDSIISRLQNAKVSSFDMYKRKKQEKGIKKLNNIKKLKSNKNYNKIVKEFEAERDQLWGRIESFSQHIKDYEIEESKKISALNPSDEERSRMYDELIYSKTNEMFKELNNDKEYQNVLKEYQDFLTINADLDDSISNSIAELEKTLNDDLNGFVNQFNIFNNVCREILELTDQICIYPFWQDGQSLEVENTRHVLYENFNIDHLVFQPYRNLLKIGGPTKQS